MTFLHNIYQPCNLALFNKVEVLKTRVKNRWYIERQVVSLNLKHPVVYISSICNLLPNSLTLQKIKIEKISFL